MYTRWYLPVIYPTLGWLKMYPSILKEACSFHGKILLNSQKPKEISEFYECLRLLLNTTLADLRRRGDSWNRFSWLFESLVEPGASDSNHSRISGIVMGLHIPTAKRSNNCSLNGTLKIMCPILRHPKYPISGYRTFFSKDAKLRNPALLLWAVPHDVRMSSVKIAADSVVPNLFERKSRTSRVKTEDIRFPFRDSCVLEKLGWNPSLSITSWT